MRIWVDLTNSPHALFFAPIVRRLQDRGDDVLVTVRRFAHTPELAAQRFDNPIIVGRGAPTSIPSKIGALAGRTQALRRIAKRFRPDVAVSHGSQDQTAAGRSLRVPTLVSVDYEHQPANHITFRLATRLLLPRAFAEQDIARHGGARKTWRYDGLKEEAYLAGFAPSADARARLGLDGHSGPVLTLRPPPEGALYHRGHNSVFDRLIDLLRTREDVLTLVLPRHPSHVEPLAGALERHNIRIVRDVVDGPNLIWWSDVMVSGGGTMNREAVALGTPVWTLFGGELGAVDRQLMAEGRLRQLHSAADVAGFNPSVRVRGDRPHLKHDVVTQFVDAIDRLAAGG